MDHLIKDIETAELEIAEESMLTHEKGRINVVKGSNWASFIGKSILSLFVIASFSAFLGLLVPTLVAGTATYQAIYLIGFGGIAVGIYAMSQTIDTLVNANRVQNLRKHASEAIGFMLKATKKIAKHLHVSK